MTKEIARSVLFAFASIVIIAINSPASPMANYKSISGYGINYIGSGGAFLLESSPGNNFTFITFCPERTNYLYLNNTYTAESLENISKKNWFNRDTNSSSGTDYISNTTKWLINEYFLNYESVLSGWSKSNRILSADLMQNAVWFPKNDLDKSYSLSEYHLLTYYQTQTGNSSHDRTQFLDYFYAIKAANIVDGQGIFKQSQLITNSVPEPATMLLFGTGLIGIAAIGRKNISLKRILRKLKASRFLKATLPTFS